MRPKPWPYKALAVAEQVGASLVDIGRRCDSLEAATQARNAALSVAAQHAREIDRLAMRAIEAVRDGNTVGAIRLLNQLRDANADARAAEQTARDHTQDMRGHVQTIRQLAVTSAEALALARRGEYRE